MAEQETLIYIDEKDLINASITAKNFAKEDIQNRAYYNSLGAELVKKFLASENFDISNIYNIHNIHKILEELDISDVMLDNIHIDVRVIFNENFIFIPKSHFNYEILPDVYLVLLMSNDKKYMNFLGFFEPKLINKNNQNEDFYFIEKEKLTPAKNLKEFIKSFEGNTIQDLATYEIDKADMMMLSMVDHDISEADKKELLQNLCKSATLRDRFIEFENFELLAFGAQTSPDVEIPTESLPRTLDYAAAATALALKDFNIKNSDPFADSDMTNGFTNVERDLPDLASDIEDLNSGFDIPTEESTTEEYSNTIAEETPEQDIIIETPTIEETPEEFVDTDLEVNEIADQEPEVTEEVVEETIEEEIVPITEEEPQITEISEDTTENKAEEVETIDDFEIVEEETTPDTEDEDSMLTAAFDETFNENDTTEISAYETSNEITNTEEIEIGNSIEITEEETDRTQEINDIVEELDAMDLAESGEEIQSGPEETFSDFSTLEEQSETPATEMTKTEEETIALETIPPVEVELSENHEIVNETVDLNELPQVKTEQTTTNSITQETVALEDISIDHEHQLHEVSMDEPALELHSFDNFSIEEQEQKAETTPIAEETTKSVDSQIETPEIPDLSELLGEPVKNETKEESGGIFIEENQDGSQPAKYEGLLTEVFHKELAPGEFTEYEETPLADMSEFETVEETPTEETTTNSTEEISSDLANFTDFSSAETVDQTSSTEEAVNTDTTPELTDMFNFEDLQNSNNDVSQNTQDENTESIADLDISVNEIGKASLIGGVEYEDGQDISTGELISQIDDLLSSEEAENSNNNQPQDIPNEIDLGEFSVDSEIKDAEDFNPQDENNLQQEEDDDDDKLAVLFNSRTGAENSDESIEDEMLGEEELEEYSNVSEDSNGNKKNMMIVGGALVALLALAGGGFMLWQNKDNLTELIPQNPNPIENDTPTNLPTAEEQPINVEANAPDNKLLASNPELDQKVAPAEKTLPPAPKVSGQDTKPAQPAKPAQATKPTEQKPTATATKPVEKKQTQAAAKPAQTQVAKSTVSRTPITNLSIKNVSWEYPDYLSHSNEFTKYLQTAGKSIKLKLTSDLLLAREHAYSHKIKVALQLRNDGTIEHAQIIQSSGSNEINDIVLRTVKETLNVVKPAPSEIPTPNFKLALIINI